MISIDFNNTVLNQEITKTEITKEHYIHEICLPVGYRNKICRVCSNQSLIAIVTPSSDFLDPEIVCLTCGWQN